MTEREEECIQDSVGKARKKDHYELGLEDNIKIELKETGWGDMDLDSSGSKQGPLEGSCEHSSGPFGSIKCWGILVWLSDWQLLNK